MKKLIRRFCCLSLAAIMLTGSSINALADAKDIAVGTEMIAVGADHTDEQRNKVYEYFGIERDGTISETVVTNADERSYLLDYISESKIGTKSYSSVYIKVTEEGDGLNLSLHNISWLTEDAYINALTTVGITDADIVIASPISVSGTAALTGIYMAYENESGEVLDADVKDVATEELVTTGELSDEIGSEEAAGIVNEIKRQADEINEMEDEEATETIGEIADANDITLTEDQLAKLLTLVRSYDKIDLSGVQDKLDEISEKLGTISVDTGGIWDSIKGFFSGIGDWFSNLFGSDEG
ncbi:MAG: DUF1002 domain-containing protein [Lachnospiraceae bacterium]